MKFSIKDFFSKGVLHLLKKSLMENFIFCVVKIIILHVLDWNVSMCLSNWLYWDQL